MTPQLDAELHDPVTRHMRRDFPRLFPGETVGEALERLRRQPPGDRVIYFYVVDDAGVLRGVVPTRRLLLSPPDTPVAAIMIERLVTLPDTATVLDACEFFTVHRLLGFPVVDADRRMLGVIDVELYTSELSDLEASERNDDLFQLIGVHLADAQRASAAGAFRRRFPWLLCNIGGGVLAAFLSGLFEYELQKTVALALFIPVVLALAESVSIQSVSLALEALRGRPPGWRDFARRLRRELATGAMLGAACAAMVAAVALVWQGNGRVALCLLGGIGAGVTAAAVIGLAAPYLLRLLRREPGVAAGPIALAAADVATLSAYFHLARWLLA